MDMLVCHPALQTNIRTAESMVHLVMQPQIELLVCPTHCAQEIREQRRRILILHAALAVGH